MTEKTEVAPWMEAQQAVQKISNPPPQAEVVRDKSVGARVMDALKAPWEEATEAAKNFTARFKEPKPVPKSNKPWDNAEAKANPQAPVDRFEKVFSNLIQAESKGKHTNAEGKLTTSPVGAQGITQVMMKTGADPGYGVAPLKDSSEGEYVRFGKDYLKAMLKEFDGDYEKALAAYNAGAGHVKKAISKGGEQWKDHLPKPKETLPYITKIMKDI